MFLDRIFFLQEQIFLIIKNCGLERTALASEKYVCCSLYKQHICIFLQQF